MTERQKYIYDYIVNKGELITSAEELVFGWNALEKGDKYMFYDKAHDKCVSLRNDIDKINQDFANEHIIINNGDYTYKVASSVNEIKEMLQRVYYDVAFNKLRKASLIVNKAKRDGNYQLLDLETLVPSEDKFIEVFKD